MGISRSLFWQAVTFLEENCMPQRSDGADHWQALIENLAANTDYTFRLRARNVVGCSEWVQKSFRTSKQRLELDSANREIRACFCLCFREVSLCRDRQKK